MDMLWINHLSHDSVEKYCKMYCSQIPCTKSNTYSIYSVHYATDSGIRKSLRNTIVS